MKAVVYTLGCKVNDVESGSIIRGLEEMGYNVSREIEKADLYIINTCAVTAEAERKSRQTVGKVFKCNPEAKIIICGCASEKSPADFLEKGHTVYAVTGAQRKNKVSKEAAKQCLRSVAPKVVYCDTLEKALSTAENYQNKLFACEFATESKCDVAALQGSTAIVIGSEGGFSREEEELAAAKGYSSVTLGKRILRAETAAVALTSVVMFALGELR